MMNDRSPLDVQLQKLAQTIANQLQETNRQAVQQILNLLKQQGVAFVQEMLDKTLAIEQSDGMLTHNKKRRRTPGGVFFYLVYGVIPKPVIQQRYIGKPKTFTPTWEAVQKATRKLIDEPKGDGKVKGVIIGRPGKIRRVDDTFVTTIEHTIKGPFPKGLPPLPVNSTTYIVYMTSKHWKRVKDAISNPEDVLIIEGSAFFDKNIGGMAFYATNVTTRLLQRQAFEKRDGE